jgi:hypothetical protein
MRQPVLLFIVAKNDAEYILKPVAEQLLAAGIPKGQARATLKVAVLRALRLAAQDAGFPVRLATNEAGRIARQLIPTRRRAVS